MAGNDASGIGDNTGILGGTLPFRTCNGDCSYESVWFDRCMDDDSRDEDGLCGGFCKTAFRPYDLAVTVFLLIAKHHLGRESGWRQMEKPGSGTMAQLLCQAELGYSLSLRGDRVRITYRIAHSLGTDAANRQMKQDGRIIWNEEDFCLAAEPLGGTSPFVSK